jgi:DNA-binding NarL/FixJ family response regulator
MRHRDAPTPDSRTHAAGIGAKHLDERQSQSDVAISPHDIRVLCVDDNPLVAEAFSVKLSRTPGFHWLGHLESTNGLQQHVAELAPDVVLLDVDIPGEDTFAALHNLSTHLSSDTDTRVLMVSGHVRPDLIDRSVEAGAWGYISKNDSSDTIVDAIRRVHEGEFVMSEIVARVYQQK